jgi:GcrA cell cycle regulator
MPAAAWTDERVAILKELWTGGATAQSIADRLGGISRSAVMGKIFRLRLGAETVVLTAAGQSQAGSDDSAKPQSPGRRRRGDKPAAAPKVSPPKRRRRRGKRLLELTNKSCRWPQGRPGTPAFFFCGAPGADLERGMPYCERHARRAYRNYESVGEAEKSADVPTDGLLPDPTPAPAREYVWRPIVRHPAARR